jgi:hypothetical protein
MSSPLTYPDQPRDDSLADFFLKMVGATVKQLLRVLLVWFCDVLP